MNYIVLSILVKNDALETRERQGKRTDLKNNIVDSGPQSEEIKSRDLISVGVTKLFRVSLKLRIYRNQYNKKEANQNNLGLVKTQSELANKSTLYAFKI